MESVSNTFKTNIKAAERATKALVIIDYAASEITYPFATVTANGTNKEQLADGRYKSSDYSYTSDDGTTTLPSILGASATGWVGTQLSDGTGDLASNEVIELTYNATYSVYNFWVIGDKDNYPVDFVIEAYYSSAWHTLATVTDNTLESYVYHSGTKLSITKFKVTISKISAYSTYSKLYECGAVVSVVYEDKDLISMSILEENASPSEKPMGNVSSNVCDVELLNTSRWFIAHNTLSPYYGVMKPRLRIQPFIGVSTATDSFEMVTMGMFWNDDWDCNSNDITFKLATYDKLKALNEETLSMIRIYEDLSVKDVLEQLLDAFDFDLADYDIDSSLTQTITYGWLSGAKFRDALQYLSEAGNCNIGMDRRNILVVKSNNITGSALETWADTNMLYEINNPFVYSSAFSKATVKAQVPKVTLKEVLKIDDVVVGSGSKTLSEVAFSSYPVLNINGVHIESTTNVTITSVTYTANNITIVLGNSGASETINIKVNGNVIEFSEMPISYDSGTDFIKNFNMNNPFIQDTAVASTYATSVVGLLTDPAATIEANARMNPALCLNDIIEISSPTDKIAVPKAAVISQEFIWDGALSGNIKFKKVS